jgi:hypothetical protein
LPDVHAVDAEDAPYVKLLFGIVVTPNNTNIMGQALSALPVHVE